MNWIPIILALGVLGLWAFSYMIDWLTEVFDKRRKKSSFQASRELIERHHEADQTAKTSERSTLVRSALNDQSIRLKRDQIPQQWSYKPPRIHSPKQESVKWITEFDAIIRRDVSNDCVIVLHEIDELKRSKPVNVVNEIGIRLSQIKSEKFQYPGKLMRIDIRQDAAPKPIGILADKDIQQIAERYQLNFRDGESFISAAEELNREINRANDIAYQRYEKATSEINIINQDLEAAHKQSVAQWQASRMAEITEIEECLTDLKSASDVAFLSTVLINGSNLPPWVPRGVEAKYDSDQKILVVEKEYPNIEEKRFLKRVQLKQSETVKLASAREQKEVASGLYSLLTLKIATDLAQLLPSDAVEFLVVNGWTNFRQKQDGHLKRAYCACVGAQVSNLRNIQLAHIEPIAAMSSLKGSVSRTLEITPVAPTIRIDVTDNRFVDSKEIIDKLTDGENLAAMDWEDFEHLCRELFEKEFGSAGATVQVTGAARDQGVDAIITDPHPIRGGKIVVQAKRYVNTVDVSAVRDLAGTVSHEGAMKGLLVTTSQFGPDSYAFIQGKPLQLINGSELLYLLEKNGYKFRIDLEEARVLQRESGSQPFGRRRH